MAKITLGRVSGETKRHYKRDPVQFVFLTADRVLEEAIEKSDIKKTYKYECRVSGYVPNPLPKTLEADTDVIFHTYETYAPGQPSNWTERRRARMSLAARDAFIAQAGFRNVAELNTKVQALFGTFTYKVREEISRVKATLDPNTSYLFEVLIEHEAYQLTGGFPNMANHVQEMYIVVPAKVSLTVKSYGFCTETGFTETREKVIEKASSEKIIPAPTETTQEMRVTEREILKRMRLEEIERLKKEVETLDKEVEDIKKQ